MHAKAGTYLLPDGGLDPVQNGVHGVGVQAGVLALQATQHRVHPKFSIHVTKEKGSEFFFFFKQQKTCNVDILVGRKVPVHKVDG